MLHGDKARFAVEWRLGSGHVYPFMYGNVCYWNCGEMVGDYDLGATLSDVLIALKYPIGDCGKRSSERFYAMTGHDAYSMLRAGLVVGDPNLGEFVEAESWARFDISLPVDVFDHWRMYLIDCKNRSRLLVGHLSAQHRDYVFAFECILSLGEFDNVIIEFATALEVAERDLAQSSGW